MTPMRVLTVGNMYPPLSLGGYELAWQSSVEHLRSRGHEVEVLTTDYRLEAGPVPDEPGVHRELRWYWYDHSFPPRGLRDRLAIERANAAALGRRLERRRPDVVVWWSMGGMSLSLIERVRRAGIPAASIVCDDWLLYGPDVDAWARIWRGWRRFAAPLAQAVTGIPAHFDPLAGVGPVLFASEALRTRARERGIEPVESEVGHRGVERDLFRAAPRPEWTWRLACVGRIDRRKGIHLAIEALAGLPAHATLAVVGEGDAAHLDELRALASELDLADRVTFTRSDRDALQEVYAAADAILFPVVWEEPWGLVPLEAMAVGAPVVASGRGGSAEYLRDRQNCLTFDAARGGAALAGAVRVLAGDPRLRERLRTGGFETAGRLSVEAYDEAIERLLVGVATAR